MSYDLVVWDGPQPATDPAAMTDFEGLYKRYAQAASPPTPRIRQFVQALLTCWPDTDDEVDSLSPWATAPLLDAASGPLVYLALVRSRVAAATPVITALAWAHALVAYAPQHERRLPAALEPTRVDTLIGEGSNIQTIAVIRDRLGCPLRLAVDILDARTRYLADGSAHPGHLAAALVLTTADGQAITDPTPAIIGRVLTGLNHDRWYATLERRDGWFIQVGVGVQAGTRAGWYALERQDGGPSRHYRTTITDLQEIITAFTGFAASDPAWTRRFAWHHHQL